jgi:hypothetical protein
MQDTGMKFALWGFAWALTLAAIPAHAGPTYSFGTSVGTQPANAGIITLTQNGANAVTVSVDLAAGYGFINTGGPHTPFAFSVQGAGALSISAWTLPVKGIYAKGTFGLNTGGGSNSPYGSYNVAIDSSAGNGSGKGYYGDLLFTISRATGLSTDDFVVNSSGYYFSADLSNGSITGAQAWTIRQIASGPQPVRTPEPLTISLMIAGLFGVAVLRRGRS